MADLLLSINLSLQLNYETRASRREEVKKQLCKQLLFKPAQIIGQIQGWCVPSNNITLCYFGSLELFMITLVFDIHILTAGSTHSGLPFVNANSAKNTLLISVRFGKISTWLWCNVKMELFPRQLIGHCVGHKLRFIGAMILICALVEFRKQVCHNINQLQRIYCCLWCRWQFYRRNIISGKNNCIWSVFQAIT